MAKPQKSRPAYPKLPVHSRDQFVSPPPQTHAMRETVESLVIAFVLAFLFRTFEAEAFVIPTGSMAPTLMGRHKDVTCPKCGHRFQITSSEEESDEVQMMRARLAQRGVSPLERSQLQQNISSMTCLAGMCPMCRYVMPVQNDLPPDVPFQSEMRPIENQPSYNGDRILVNKYVYTLSDPKRWDIVVFKFPGNAQMNYIKRLVGLPGETIRVYQGDLFVGHDKTADDEAAARADFKIASKPPDKVLAMRQVVHDTDYDPAELYQAGWPLRWQAETSTAGDQVWQIDAQVDGEKVRQRYTIDSREAADPAWLRYRHFIPDYDEWQAVMQMHAHAAEQPAAVTAFSVEQRAAFRSRLITDFNAYNARVSRRWVEATGTLSVEPTKSGLHWVGDLMVEADVQVKSADRGTLLVDLVEGGRHFTCRIDLADGTATLGIDGVADFAPSGKTRLSGPGSYRIALANVDDQLLLWINDQLVSFEGSTHYDADAVFGDRHRIRPQTSANDPGDLAPVGIGAQGAELEVTRLRVWRDNYYIADSWRRNRGEMVTDFANPQANLLAQLAVDPALWDEFLERRPEDFPLGGDQYFVMGDNSPESLDARLWRGQNPRDRGRPGGAYLEREMLIGKALCVYWPHSWNRIPGTPIPLPLFPNFADMRLVR